MPAKREYPEGTIFGEWFISLEAKSYTVKRMVYLPEGKRSAQRQKKSHYEKLIRAYSDREIEQINADPDHPRLPPKVLQDYVTRLNGKDPRVERLKIEMKFRHAFINEAFLDQYKKDEIYSSVLDRSNADTVYGYLTTYALHWFLNLKKAYTVQAWKEHEKEWGSYLINQRVSQDEMLDELRIFKNVSEERRFRPQNRQLSGKVLGYTLFEINRFIRYIYKKRRSEFEDELIQLEPWGKKFLETYDAERRVKNPPKPSRYIPPKHWEIITAAMLKQKKIWRHEVWLAHDYGLRRCETMGLDELSVKAPHLLLTRQLDFTEMKDGRQIKAYKSLKGREQERKIPHWFGEAKITRARIKAILSDDLPHPDTISEGFNTFCATLRDEKGAALPAYRFHDLRRSFCTNAVKSQTIKLEDLMQATGHKSESVLRDFYLMDSRELEGELSFEDDDEEIVV